VAAAEGKATSFKRRYQKLALAEPAHNPPVPVQNNPPVSPPLAIVTRLAGTAFML